MYNYGRGYHAHVRGTLNRCFCSIVHYACPFLHVIMTLFILGFWPCFFQYCGTCIWWWVCGCGSWTYHCSIRKWMFLCVCVIWTWSGAICDICVSITAVKVIVDNSHSRMEHPMATWDNKNHLCFVMCAGATVSTTDHSLAPNVCWDLTYLFMSFWGVVCFE